MARHFFLSNPERAVKFLSSTGQVLTDTVLDDNLVRKLSQDGRLTFVICDAILCYGVDLIIVERINYIKV